MVAPLFRVAVFFRVHWAKSCVGLEKDHLKYESAFSRVNGSRTEFSNEYL